MQEHQTVVIFGSSLFSTAIEISLRYGNGFRVVQIEDTNPDAEQHILTLCPEVIVVDAIAADWDVVMSCLKHHPTMAIIGLDPTSSKALVLWSLLSPVASMKELATLIHTHMPSNQHLTCNLLN